MICPVMSVDGDKGCVAKHCAWWIPTRGCAIQAIAKEMVHSRLELEAERDRKELLALSRVNQDY